MVLIRASPVVRPRICGSRNIGGRGFFAFVADWLARSLFIGTIGAFLSYPSWRLFGRGTLAFFPGRDDDFEAAVFMRFERTVCLENVVERVSFRNKAARVDEPLLDEGKRLFEPRCIHAARFEDEILAVHAGQRQRLIILVHSGNHHHGVGPRDAP